MTNVDDDFHDRGAAELYEKTGLPLSVAKTVVQSVPPTEVFKISVSHHEEDPTHEGHESYIIYAVAGARLIHMMFHGEPGGDHYEEFTRAISLASIRDVEIRGETGTISVDSEKGVYTQGVPRDVARMIIRRGRPHEEAQAAQ